jgi:hypothetical protein
MKINEEQRVRKTPPYNLILFKRFIFVRDSVTNRKHNPSNQPTDLHITSKSLLRQRY